MARAWARALCIPQFVRGPVGTWRPQPGRGRLHTFDGATRSARCASAANVKRGLVHVQLAAQAHRGVAGAWRGPLRKPRKRLERDEVISSIQMRGSWDEFVASHDSLGVAISMHWSAGSKLGRINGEHCHMCGDVDGACGGQLPPPTPAGRLSTLPPQDSCSRWAASTQCGGMWGACR